MFKTLGLCRGFSALSPSICRAAGAAVDLKYPLQKRYSSCSEQFSRDGFTVKQNALPQELVRRLLEKSNQLCDDPDNAHFRQDRFTGSLIPLSKDPLFAELIAHPSIQSILTDELGMEDLRWMSGFIITKPPHSPSLGWHQDTWYWNEDVAYSSNPAQVFAMYYLTDTTSENGCLRVLPGTHRKEHPLHAQLGLAHSDDVRSGDTEEEAQARVAASPAHAPQPDEVHVPVKAGDVVIGDARVLHGAVANTTDEPRALLTLWYIPEYTNLPRTMQENICTLHNHQVGELHTEWGQADVATLEEAGMVPRPPTKTDLDLWRASQPNSNGDGDGNVDGGSGDGSGDGSGGLDADEYDHNLDFMHRQPGWNSGDATTAEAVETYENFKLWADYYPNENP